MLLTAFLVCADSDTWVLINEPSWIRRRKKATPSATLVPVIRNTRVLFILFMSTMRAGFRWVAGSDHDFHRL